MQFVIYVMCTVGSVLMVSSVSASDVPYEGSQPVSSIQVQKEMPATGKYLVAYASSSIPKYRGAKRAFPSRIRPTGKRVFIFSPRKLAWAAYLPNGRMIGYGRASGGAGYCRDVKRACRTPRGTFRVIRKGKSSCRSSRYPLPRGGAPMPYCMFFSKYYAIHGSPDVPNYNASHGCVRVKPKAAAWLSRYFIRIGTTVIVRSY